MKNFKDNIFTFGKYKGELIEDIEDKKYLEWVLEELESGYENTDTFAKNIEYRLAELNEIL